MSRNNKFAHDARETYPAPDGTALGNLRHVVALFADSDPNTLVVQATSNVYPFGPGVIRVVEGGATTYTGLTHGDLRDLLRIIDGQGTTDQEKP